MFGLLAAALQAPAAQAAVSAAAESSPWLSALSSAYVVVDTSTGDLDGDGRDETVVCYREDAGRTEQKSGIAVLSGRTPALRPVFHVQLEVLCEKTRIQGRKLGILLRGNKQLIWTYGEELRFRGDRGSFMGQITVRGSSSMDWQHKAEKAFDGDLGTSWAEGEPGTGLGQTITLKLPRPIHVGAIGIYGGNGNSPGAFFDNNRIHRASLEAKTDADMGDASAGVDFASLGIDSMGDRIEFSCENKPQVSYVHVNQKSVLELELRIESVYLGDRKDDTHIAEIELVPLLPLSETLDKATPTKSGGVSLSPAPETDQTDQSALSSGGLAVTPDGSVGALDADGRSIVSDDL